MYSTCVLVCWHVQLCMRDASVCVVRMCESSLVVGEENYIVGRNNDDGDAAATDIDDARLQTI